MTAAGFTMVAPPSSTGSTFTISTPTDWANAQLAYMGFPDTQSNVAFLVGWYNREGGHWQNTARYNPLNTTLRLGQANTPINNVGVQAYGSWGQGLQATAMTLQGYPNITAALAAGDASQADQSGYLASDLLKWSGSGYSTVQPQGSTATTATAVDTSTWSTIKNAVGGALNGILPGGGITASPGTAIVNGNPIGAVTGSVQGIGNFFSMISKKSTWIRIAQVAGGFIALAAGGVILARAIGMGAVAAGLAGVVGKVPVASAAVAPARQQAGLGRARRVPSKAPARARTVNRQVQKEGTEAYDAGYQKGHYDASQRRARETPL